MLSASVYAAHAGVGTRPDTPPPYFTEIIEEKPTVEVCALPPNPDFEVDGGRQRHFGILRYTVNNRFYKLLLIGLVNLILIVGVLLLVFLVFLKVDNNITTTTTPAPYSNQPDSCIPLNETTFLFAYSNDFNSSTVLEVLNSVDYYQIISKHYTHFGAVRFDVRDQEEFYLHGNWSDINDYVKTHLPDPSLSFKDSKNGSDVLAMIDRLSSIDQVPICGARVFIMVSTSQSAGQSPETLYDLATKTNGVCGFDADENMGAAVTYLETVAYPYLVYAVNPSIGQSGSSQLNSLLVPDRTFYAIVMTIQNYEPVEEVNNVTLSWSLNSVVDGSIGTTSSPGVGNHLSLVQRFKRESYTMILDYDYSVVGSRRLQIRIYGTDYSAVDQWQPYDD